MGFIWTFIWTAVLCTGTERRAVRLTSDYWMPMSSYSYSYRCDSYRCFYTLPNVSGVGQLLLFECHCVGGSMLLRTCQRFLSEFRSQRIRVSAVRWGLLYVIGKLHSRNQKKIQQPKQNLHSDNIS